MAKDWKQLAQGRLARGKGRLRSSQLEPWPAAWGPIENQVYTGLSMAGRAMVETGFNTLYPAWFIFPLAGSWTVILAGEGSGKVIRVRESTGTYNPTDPGTLQSNRDPRRDRPSWPGFSGRRRLRATLPSGRRLWPEARSSLLHVARSVLSLPAATGRTRRGRQQGPRAPREGAIKPEPAEPVS